MREIGRGVVEIFEVFNIFQRLTRLYVHHAVTFLGLVVHVARSLVAPLLLFFLFRASHLHWWV